MSEEPISVPPPGSEQAVKRRQAGAILQQIGVNMFLVGLVGLVIFLAWQRFSPQDIPNAAAPAAQSEAEPIEAAEVQIKAPPPMDASTLRISLGPLTTPAAALEEGIQRKIEPQTMIPTRPRVDVITYTVQTGDTLFSIADQFKLKPETILWGNYEVLEDNPHLLKPDQVLNILPINGTYYKWTEGDNLGAIASFFQVEPQAILEFAGNRADLTLAKEGSAGWESGQWLIIPDGKRAIKDWGPPAITRKNAAAARYYGDGACGAVYEGAIGTGTFVWPTTDRSISGYNYDPGVHPAIDIGGQEGNPIYATDSGVIVYAGWSNYGYGYLIVIDHGNGWQSAYAHLSAVAVGCGQSVYQGGYIGALGTTGNSSGPHLHFELVINGLKINPLSYLQ